MKTTRRAAPLLLVTLLACGGNELTPPPVAPPPPSATAARPKGPPPAEEPPPVTTKIDADGTWKTVSGNPFQVARGWSVTSHRAAIVLEDPDRELAVTFVENKEPDATQAIAAAWWQVKPEFARNEKQTTRPPPRNGWDEIVQVEYETSTEESRIVIALARRKGDGWVVSLIDGTKASFDRRSAQAMTAIMSLKAPGFEDQSLKGKKANALDEARLKAFEAFVADAMAKTKVPGAAIVIVQNGKTVLEKGYGVRELGQKAAVTPETLFMIGSTTKSLTSLMMAELVDQGKFTWDTPVTQLLPTFALGDAEATRKLLLRHTVCACTGLPRQDMEFLFEYAGATAEKRLDAMRTMKPTTGFGETFQYSNSLVSAGGYAAAHAVSPKKKLGPAYREAMQSLVFGPLGMKNTTLDAAAVKKKEHATPHAENLKQEVSALPLQDEDGVVSVGPAGAAWSSVHDMARYLQVELNKGKTPEGKQIVSEANLLKRREPQVKITDQMSYGLGLFVQQDHGQPIIHHGGNTLGFTSDMFLLPEQGIGVVVLTNEGSANAFRNALKRRLIEILFDAPEEAAQNLAFALDRTRQALDKELAQITLQPEASWYEGLAGSYQNAELGQVTIRKEGKGYVLDAGEWRSSFGLKKETDGSQKIALLDAPWSGFEFYLGHQDSKKLLIVDQPQHKYIFVPVSAPATPARKK
jgi:CubicO group peptidase (beta-lactamase class C family)